MKKSKGVEVSQEKKIFQGVKISAFLFASGSHLVVLWDLCSGITIAMSLGTTQDGKK